MIPGTQRSFRGARASIDRPFAAPGDFIAVRISPACDSQSPGFGATAAEHVVTVVFKPPTGSADRNNVVILSTDCAALEAARQSCEARSDIGSATCLPINGAGQPAGAEIALRDSERFLRFRFPDTDTLLGAANDEHTFAGPATIAITRTGDPLPCQLASSSCAAESGLVACVDQLFALDGSCGEVIDSTFPHFTALPPPNNYAALCSDPVPPCTATAGELRFTTDTAGNILMPMDWRGILVGQGVPIARLLRGSAAIAAFDGGATPIRIPGNGFLRSFSIEGGLLPPLFDPQADAAAANEAVLFGSADAPATVLRIARRSPSATQCLGGSNEALPCIEDSDCPAGSCGPALCHGGSADGDDCSSDGDCPGGECGAALFDFRTRFLADIGPVVVPRFGAGVCQSGANIGQACDDDAGCPTSVCVAYRMSAEDPVSLEGLNQTAQLFAFVVPEELQGHDLNGDGDAIDDVVMLTDRRTGSARPLGVAADGRATVRLHQAPFSFPAVATEGDLVAFLQPEPLQGNQDSNGNGQVFENTLQAFKLDSGSLTPQAISADAAPLLDGRSLAISAGRIFFRTEEAAVAQQRTTIASVDSNGNVGSGMGSSALISGSMLPSVSGDGRYVVFLSGTTTLVPGDTNERDDVFLHDLWTGETIRVNVSTSGQQADSTTEMSPYISANGRHVLFASVACNLDQLGCAIGSSAYVRDRDTDDDGIFDELGAVKTVRVSIDSNGNKNIGTTLGDRMAISADGRFVVFPSDAANLVAGDTNNTTDIFVHDRDLDRDGIFDEPGAVETSRANVSTSGEQANAFTSAPGISDDGRFVVFQSYATNLVAGDTNEFADIFLHDRDTDEDGIFDEPGAMSTIRVSVDSFGTEADGRSLDPRISGDGSTISFITDATNLVVGDNNAFRDVLVYDRITAQVTLVSRTPWGAVSGGHSGNGPLSRDGRFITFNTDAANVVQGPFPASRNIYVHDRLTGLTVMASRTDAGAPAAGESLPPSMLSADGHHAAFANQSDALVSNDTNGKPDVFVRGPDPASGDLTGDGDNDDGVLQVLDSVSVSVTALCPASAVAIAAGMAAFLRPESAGAAPELPLCPSAALLAGKPDLNGDGDTDDAVVHLWNGTTVQNLGVAATALAMSSDWIAILVDENQQGAGSLNGDADSDDLVVQVHASAGGTWRNLGTAAETIAVAGDMAAFLVPEQKQGGDLNDDGDQDDRVVHVYNAATDELVNLGQAGEELVIGASGLIAFRTRESAQGDTDLNLDGDSADDVLQVYDAISAMLLNSKQAVTPCRLEACDPRIPYRVLDDTVTFLTLEPAQGQDLNGDGDSSDLVLQVLNVRQALAQGTVSDSSHPLASVTTGVCTDTGNACTDDDDCPQGTCFVPPGGCVRDTSYPCNPTIPDACGTPWYCQPSGVPGQGSCFKPEGPCTSDADCTAPAFCNDTNQGFELVGNPLADHGEGATVLAGAGRCIEPLAGSCIQSSDCSVGGTCTEGHCQRDHGVCTNDDDCPLGIDCVQEVTSATAADSDGDEVPDAVDNCPSISNVLQEDIDGNRVGDACDVTTRCGNGVINGEETCDDGNAVDGDGCDANCTLSACGNGVRAGAEACDDGNLVSGDGCDANCRPTGCGNQVVTAPELCDDGNSVSGDGCDANCRPTGCGNAVRTAGEACDDGNLAGGDGCEANCTYSTLSAMVGAGATFSTGSGDGIATAEFPLQAAITTPTGGAIAIAPATAGEPAGFAVVGLQLAIEAPPATALAPLLIELTVDGSAIPVGVDPVRLEVTRNAILVADCSGPAGVASPDPCLTSRELLLDGDVRLKVLTSHASLWSIVIRGLAAAEQRCVNAMNGGAVRMLKAYDQELIRCVQAAAEGELPDAQACLDAAASGKVAKANTYINTVAQTKCAPAPLFGYSSALTVAGASAGAVPALVTDLLGADWSSAIAASGNATASCQASLLGRVRKLLETKATLFLKCKKNGLAGKTALMISSPSMERCFASLRSEGGKAGDALGRLAATLQECSDVAAALPGSCGSSVDAATCIDRRLDCRLCRMFNATDGLATDCDLFDDAAANGSCL